MNEFDKVLSRYAKDFDNSLTKQKEVWYRRIGRDPKAESADRNRVSKSWDSMSNHERNAYLYGSDYMSR